MFLRHRFDDFVEIFRLVIEGEIGCIDLAGHAPLVNLPALLHVGDGGHPGRPMVLDASKAGFGSEKDIQTVASHRQSEPVTCHCLDRKSTRLTSSPLPTPYA